MIIHEISTITDEASKIVQKKFDLKYFGSLMNETWKLKNLLSQSVSSHKIDNIYLKGIKDGALGGKLLGAGGGGFILLLSKMKKRKFLNKMNKFVFYY